MEKRPQVGVIGSAAFAQPCPGNTSLEAYADARKCCMGGGAAAAMKQIIGNALLTKMRKAT